MENLWLIVSKPDNVPIVLMLILVGFFTWLALYLGWKNDRYKAEHGDKADALYPIEEKGLPQKVHVWPHLLKVEFLAAILVMVLLTIWSLTLMAPLEDPSNPAQTPNPSKAPWYFLGLQEMLVYFDPWIAGVLLPTFIVTGLMIIPYCDINPKGNGYYTIRERKYALSIFLFGLIVLWVPLIIVGTFLRGPGWILFLPWEFWDPHAVMYESNRDLSQLFGIDSDGLMGTLVGAGFLGAYFAVILGGGYGFLRARAPEFLARLGLIRYVVLAVHFAFMMSLPIKMVMRLGFRIKYIMKIPAVNLNV